MNSSSTETRTIRRFGLIAFFFFGGLFALSLWRNKAGIGFVFCGLGMLGLAFLLLPGPLSPLYLGWLKFSTLIGRMMTLVILALTYFLVVTPTAWLKRVFGGRPLPEKPDRSVSSYWVTRSEPAQPKERFIKRY
jgi:hypothetical protein